MIYIVLFFSFVIRLISLNQSLWLDEATTALVSQISIYDFFIQFMSADFHPPLYYLVIHYWTLITGTSEVALRIPSVIFGVLSVNTIYLVAKDLKFRQPIIPAIFLATSGLHIYYSQEVRMYMMVTWLVSYLVLSFINKKWLLVSMILPLIFLTDYLSILIVPTLLVYTFVYLRKDIKKFVYSLIPLGLVFILWLPTFSRQLINGMSVKNSVSGWWNILGPVTFKNILLIPTKFIIGRISIDDKIIYAVIVGVLIGLYAYFILRTKNKLVWFWFLLCLVFGILISFLIPTLTYFRYLFVLPAFYLLISENANKYIIGFVLSINLVTSYFYLFNSKFNRENWKDLAPYIGDTKIVLPSNSQKEALIYYGKSENIIKREELNSKQKEIYLSRYVWDIFDQNDTTRKYIEKLGYNKESEINFNGVILFKYYAYRN